MKKLLLLLILVIPLSSVEYSHAQNLGRYLDKKAKQASKRAANKADEEVTEEMYKKVDKGVESIFDEIFSEEESENTEGSKADTTKKSSGSSSSSDDAMAKAMLGAMGITTGSADINDKYDYTGNIKMLVQSWDEDGESEGEIDYITYTTNDYKGFAMEFTQEGAFSTMIFDVEKNAMIILTESDGQKTGIVTQYEGDADWMNEDFAEDYEEIDDYSLYNDNLKKTGRTKTIAGFKCDEYSFEDEESKGSVWMTNELPPELWAKMYSTNAVAIPQTAHGGFMMEMEQYSKSDDSRYLIRVKEVNENQSKSISTKGYQIMSFGLDPSKYEDMEEEE